MFRLINRRTFAASTVAAAIVAPRLSNIGPFGMSALAQSQGLGDLDLPTIEATILTDSFDGLPAELEAGRYLLTATLGDGVDFGTAAFVRGKEGETVEDMMDIIASATDPSVPPPTDVYQWLFAGGAIATPAGPGQSVIDLEEGEWLVWGDDPTAPQMPTTLTVTGKLGEDLVDPEATIEVEFIDFGITISGDLTAGEHVFHIANSGAQPHFIVVIPLPEGTTDDDLGVMLESMMSEPEGASSPEAEAGAEEEPPPVFLSVTQSIGTSQWNAGSLEAGTYGGLCFFPTAGTGAPHAFMGMHHVFEVTA